MFFESSNLNVFSKMMHNVSTGTFNCRLAYPSSFSLTLYFSAIFVLSRFGGGVPRRQPHRRSGLATLPSVGAVP